MHHTRTPHLHKRQVLLAILAMLATSVATPSLAADKVKVGVFPSSSALPYFVALERGYFKEVDIETEAVTFNAHPLTVQAIVTGDIDVASNLVTLEGANINQRRPNTLTFISLNGQNSQYITEQFVVRIGSTAQSLKDLKGAKIMSAPGPANLAAAKAVLKSAGLEEGKDYTIQEQQMGVHIGAMQANTFDAAYTLEPLASMMIRQGAARRLEAGVISTHLLGRKEALAFAAGGALSNKFMTERPQVAARFASAWAKAVNDVARDAKVRELLPKYMNTSADIAPTVPLAKLVLIKDLTAQDMSDFQKFVDIGIQQGVIKGAVDVKTLIKAY